MATTIGSLAATITANADPMLKGLAKGESGVASFAGNVKKQTASITSSIGAMVKSTVKGLGDIGLAATGLRSLIDAAGTPWTSFTKGIDDLIKMDDTARHLGLTVAELQGAIVWSGKSAEEMTAAITITQGKLHDLAAGGVTASREFANLAAVSGMTVQAISAGGWSGVYEAIAKINDPTRRAAQAFRYLGSDATKFLDALAGGGSNNAARIAQGFGMGVTANDVNNARTIVQTLGQINALKQGFFNQVLTGIAPVVAELTTLFDLTKINLSSIADSVLMIVEQVGLFASQLAAIVSNSALLKSSFEALGSTIEGLGHRLSAVLLDASAKVAQSLIGPSAAASLRQSADLSRTMARHSFDRAEMNPFNQRSSLYEDMMESPIVKGFQAFMKRAWDRRNAPLPGRESTAPMQLDKLRAAFDQSATSVRSPLDAWMQSAADLRNFSALGLLQGEGGTAGRIGFQMLEALRSGTNSPLIPPLAGAATFNTREAYSAVAQYQMQGRRETPLDEMKRLMELAAKQDERKIEIGREIVKEITALREAENELEIE